MTFPFKTHFFTPGQIFHDDFANKLIYCFPSPCLETTKTNGNADTDVETAVEPKGKLSCCKRAPKAPSIPEAMDKKRVALCHLAELRASIPLSHIILDCSAWNFVDLVGVNTLKSVRLYLFLSRISLRLVMIREYC